VEDHEALLLRLAIRDDGCVASLLASEAENLAASKQTRKIHALVQVAALVSLGAATPSYLAAVDAARDSGATDAEIVGTLVAVLPIVGVPRVVSATPHLALAMGYDVSEALEAIDAPAPADS
jgi:hypothetical protein